MHEALSDQVDLASDMGQIWLLTPENWHDGHMEWPLVAAMDAVFMPTLASHLPRPTQLLAASDFPTSLHKAMRAPDVALFLKDSGQPPGSTAATLARSVLEGRAALPQEGGTPGFRQHHHLGASSCLIQEALSPTQHTPDKGILLPEKGVQGGSLVTRSVGDITRCPVQEQRASRSTECPLRAQRRPAPQSRAEKTGAVLRGAVGR